MTDETIISIAAGVVSGVGSGAVAAWFRARAEVKKVELEYEARQTERKEARDAGRENADRELISAARNLEQKLRSRHKGPGVSAARRALREATRDVAQASSLRKKADELAKLANTKDPDAIRRLLDDEG